MATRLIGVGGGRFGVHAHLSRLRRSDHFVTSEPTEGVVEVTPPETWASGVPAVVSSLTRNLAQSGVRRTVKALRVINQEQGFDCPSCAWPEASPGLGRHIIEFCESGAKAVAEETTTARVRPAFFAEHSIADLAGRSEFWLGRQGRLTSPMIKRPGGTHYEPISWTAAHTEIATQLAGLASPDEAVFYTSGRTSNEAAFLFQLLVRSFGTNNLPDCSNMCHESTSVALADAIGIGKGSVTLEDFTQTDLILIVGQNPGTNAPRMLTTLEEAKETGARILAINPLPEAGLLNFKNPQRVRGVVGRGTDLADQHLAVRLGGDQALFQFWNHLMLRREREHPGTIDWDFITNHTAGYADLAVHLEAVDEQALIAATGLDRSEIEQAFELIASSKRMIICWAMGITQHVNALETIREMTNLALLGGHIGRPGAGLCPVRGHSNVQGDRTMGIWDRPKPSFLDALEHEYRVPMPREDGLDVINAVRAFADGRAKILFAMGGNFVRATSDSDLAEAALGSTQLTVHVSTKLNRSHLTCGDTAIILPTLGRTEIDARPGGDQFVTVEDSFGQVHRSFGVLPPGSDLLRSEVAIVCDLAIRLLGSDHPVPWSTYRDDYDEIRGAIGRVVPGFERFNSRVREIGGFTLPHPPRDERHFPTANGKAGFAVTEVRPASVVPGQLVLQTLRSHDQFNTTIYGHDDRYRGIQGDRHVVMVNADDLRDLGLADGQVVDIVSTYPDRERRVTNYRIIAYPTPRGCAAAYYPETNALISIDHFAPRSNTPASKAVPIRLVPVVS